MPNLRNSFLPPVYMDCVKFDPQRFGVELLEVKIRQTEWRNDMGQVTHTRFHLWSVRNVSRMEIVAYFNPWLMIENAKKELARLDDHERKYPTSAASKEYYKRFPENATLSYEYSVARQKEGISAMKLFIESVEADMPEIPLPELRKSLFMVYNCDERGKPVQDMISVYKENYEKVARYERGCDGHYHPEGYKPPVTVLAQSTEASDEPSRLKLA